MKTARIFTPLVFITIIFTNTLNAMEKNHSRQALFKAVGTTRSFFTRNIGIGLDKDPFFYASLYASLYDAAEKGDEQKTQKSLDQIKGVRGSLDNVINYRGCFGLTALHKAVIGNKQQNVELLLKHKANPDIQDSDGFAPLHFAALGKLQLTQLLLTNNANVNIKSNTGGTPLHVAVYYGHSEIVKHLMQKGANTILTVIPTNCFRIGFNHGGTPLQYVVQNDHKAIAIELLKHNSVEQLAARDQEGLTPLHWVARKRKSDWVKLFLEKGADPNARSSRRRARKEDRFFDLGETPLHWAVLEGCPTSVEYLLAGGARVDEQTTYDKQTALHIASKQGNHRLQCATSLILGGADSTIRDKYGQLPIISNQILAILATRHSHQIKNLHKDISKLNETLATYKQQQSQQLDNARTKINGLNEALATFKGLQLDNVSKLNENLASYKQQQEQQSQQLDKLHKDTRTLNTALATQTMKQKQQINNRREEISELTKALAKQQEQQAQQSQQLDKLHKDTRTLNMALAKQTVKQTHRLNNLHEDTQALIQAKIRRDLHVAQLNEQIG